jgi:hypothetical protein
MRAESIYWPCASIISSWTSPPPHLYEPGQGPLLDITFSNLGYNAAMQLTQLGIGALALLPTTLACLGYEGGVPTPTSTKTNSKVITVPAGTVYDGGWAKFDRGSGACADGEGGK